MTVLAASRVVTPTGVLAPGLVELDGDRIASVAETSGRVPDRVLVPGFIDLQVNGIDDVDVADADDAGWDRLDGLLAAQGTTSWLPTLVTAPLDAYSTRLEGVARAQARPGPRPRIVGAHLEGPFIGGRIGAHSPADVVPVDIGWLQELPPVVRLVTVGAEAPETADAVRTLLQRRVLCAIGHTDATLAQAATAIDAGARLVTHGFNAMSPLHHREPGLVGAFLTDDRVTVSVIADGVHVHPIALDVGFRCKPEGRIALVTDAVGWRSRRAAASGVAHDGAAPRLQDGTLAGSTTTMDASVAFVVDRVGISLERAVRAAATTPASLLGLADRGALATGRRADVVALDPASLRCTETWIDGTQVHG